MNKRCFSSIILILVLFGLWIGARPDDEKKSGDVKTFTAFFSVSGETRDADNAIMELIADRIGARCEEYWLSGQTVEDALNDYIASGEYPNFISGGRELYEAGALIPIDVYWEEYPNIYNYLSQEEWDTLRQEDGHIYWMPQFGVVGDEDVEVIHTGEAFWIQTRVLKWADYPDIRTVDEYFDLLERYMAANSTMEDGQVNIPFTILCDDWRYFVLENVPQFLDGYPNDGSCMVDPETMQILDYNTTPTAKSYYQKLNEECHKGMIDPESFTSTYEEYLEKLSTGAVLGMVDQWWQFAYDIGPAFEKINAEQNWYNYVPLPVTLSRDVQNQWHVSRASEFDISAGISVTTSCQDIEGAFQFINDLLEEDVLRLRFWGVEGVDYEVDENGRYYQTKEQNTRANDAGLLASHYCYYSYFPRKEGLARDGINAYIPEDQQSETYNSLPADVIECLQAYGCRTYVDMLGTHEKPGKWYPMYSYSDQLTYSTRAGSVWKKMIAVKQDQLPKVIMSDDFETAWEEYMQMYQSCEPQIFFDAMQRELERRVRSR